MGRGPGADGDRGGDGGAPAVPAGAGVRTDLRGPAFWALEGGMARLADTLATRLGGRGVALHTGTRVAAMTRADGPAGGWDLELVGSTDGGPPVRTRLPADAVVLATPAPVTADLLEPHDAEAASLLRGIDHASVAVVTMAFPASAVPGPLYGTGLLVPAARWHRQRWNAPAPIGDPRLLTTACTFLSTKWPHLARPDEFLVRASAGHYGDDRPAALGDAALVTRVGAELEALLGLTGEPTEASVTRWADAFPQYRVHHLLRVTGIEAAIQRLPALALAGATYRGVGIPACVGSGRAAARTVLAALADQASGARPAR